MTALPADELRLLVREVLRDLLPAISAATAPTAPAGSAPAGHVPGASAETLGRTPAAEPVVIGGDDDLNAFALRVLDLAADPARAAALRSGRLRFRLAAPAPEPAPVPAAQPAQEAVRQEVVRHEKGAVTERHVAAAAAAGARLVLGRRAVLTPLARERARACGLAVERED
ncbi:hypothetical protein [Microbispora catharanthi]|uniref:Uncharacterized protein n=1 Tax=Microbispora catharanthi TaxID=1712871 RepID=A0A5N6BVZ9_9ACTN|nr:hypothetical protein [Microbispora catharanthi]KAB8184618.1 hypothetical protein FH610_016180 [Microbispora catharanthi]